MPVRYDNPDHRAATYRVAPAALALAMAVTLAAPLAAHAAEGLREVRDPVTGEMRGPNAAEVAAFARAEAQLRQQKGLAAAVQPQTEIVHPDGAVELKLGDDTMLYSVVRANEDGSLAMACLPAKEAKAFVSKSAKGSAAAKAKAKALTQAHGGHRHE
jgi:hypothetical protein